MLFQPHPYFNINVHLDGLKNTHDLIVEKDGAYDKAVEGIKSALAQGFTVCTNTTIYKQTPPEEVLNFIDELETVGVNGILLSPSYGYADVNDQSIFLTKKEIVDKFQALSGLRRSKKIWSTPIYLDFLEGRREISCTPWGNVTYNIKGWKAPCYLITDDHFDTYADFIKRVEWDRFGPGRDKRCEHCLVHCGFEATVALMTGNSWSDTLRMARWTFL